jgi:bifunctional non-homologous end joining protein LigD
VVSLSNFRLPVSKLSCMNTESITLYYRKGTSDKVYRVSLKQESAGWVVNYEYGRRGSAMTAGTKTKSALEYPQAKKIYDRVAGEQLRQGYTPGENGVPFQATVREERSTGITPQLLNPIESSEVSAFILNRRFVLQEKFDGRRTLIRLLKGNVEGINRTGLVVALPETLAQAVAASDATSVILDGELLGDGFVSFDILELDGKDLRGSSYELRLALLSGIANLFGSDIRLVETAVTVAEKRKLYDRLVQEKREGVVFKELDAAYVSGRPASGGSQRKCKFYETASFVIGTINSQRSVGLCLYRDGNLVPAGNVTIPPNAEIPQSGRVIEVKYLYAFQESGVVYQPVYLQERNDILPEDCVVGQLKFKKP